jgi:UDP-2,4-diacetamido-2,4,6-trideoxy-beta-L-altropyranose hydrolase
MGDPISSPPHLLIRADASTDIGTGHVMRMIALAQAYQDRGGAVTLASVTCPEGLADRVRGEGIRFEPIQVTPPGNPLEPPVILALARSLGSQWVVLDGYHFDLTYQEALRGAGLKVMVVDDYGHCEHWSADAILNQNPYAPELCYRSDAANCRSLLGPRFALLRREFREEAIRQPERPPVRTGPIHRLLITLGGADMTDVTGRLLDALNTLSEPPLEIKVVLGAGNPHRQSIAQRASTSPHAVELLQNILDMPSLYRWAEGVISAGGGTCWEWLFHQLPAAVVCVADNQRAVVACLAEHRLAVDLGWHETLDQANTSQKLHDWLAKPQDCIADTPPALAVDGFGPGRVASVLDSSAIWLRPATETDCDLYFEWANDSEVRRNAVQTGPIARESHVQWYRNKLQSTCSKLYLAMDLDDRPVGQVRFDRNAQGVWEVDLSVPRELRARGLGGRMFRLALLTFRFAVKEPVLARVKPGNDKSARIFRRLGFLEISNDPAGFLQFVLQA